MTLDNHILDEVSDNLKREGNKQGMGEDNNGISKTKNSKDSKLESDKSPKRASLSKSPDTKKSK
eukprot:CAMPEP_0116916598 /NCGR_PEP_ID=MMETSP0467-20121206/18633_1 /TAXON_ID=283647 /ORGANISM="Mesodinium pulex, Strain SPMC105" /LENGTH=63 /DNA_ID=CAMNT_0004593511 /DNA_START=1446 /DNA_END=1637 /DNA_ORIENTATION=-